MTGSKFRLGEGQPMVAASNSDLIDRFIQHTDK